MTQLGGEPRPTPERLTTRTSRSTLPLVILLAGIVVLAVAKPWDAVPPPDGGAPSGQAATGSGPNAAAGSTSSSAEAVAAPTPVANDPNATPCMSANGERLVTLIRTPSAEVREWQLVDDGEGRDAFQPGLVPVRVTSGHVVGIGMCAAQPDRGSQVSPAAQVLDVILVTGANGEIVDLGAPRVITLAGDRDDAVLYAAPSSLRIGPNGSFVPPRPSQGVLLGQGPQATLATWAVGSYAMAFRYPADPPLVVRWIRFDIVAGPGAFD